MKIKQPRSTMKYDVTIGIPVYNAEKYIEKTLESALGQTFGSIEFLIVDDRGTDRSIDIVNNMRSSHPRGEHIRILAQPHNKGVAMARNRIIDEARGEYLYFMDSDDVISANCISLLHANAKEHDAEIVFGSYEKIELFKPDPQPLLYQYPRQLLLEEHQLAQFAYRKYGGIQASVCNYLVRVEVLRGNSIRFIDSRYWEDMVFTFDLVTYITRAVTLPDITYSYLCRENSLSNYQQRSQISKDEIAGNVKTVDTLKASTRRMLGKPYLGNRCFNIVMTDLYVACNIIKNRNIIKPAVTDAELREWLRHPLHLEEIMKLESGKAKNLLLYLLPKMPGFTFVMLVRMFAKYKRII